jgi:predicted ATPase
MIRIVITGGPSTGKTSLINELANFECTTFPEVARILIKEQLEINSNKVPWGDVSGFSKLVLDKQVVDFNEAEKGLNIYDRGIPDLIGYMNHGKQELFNDLKINAKKFKYQFVFILSPWKDIYETDNERRESFEDAIKIYESIKSAYIQLGYTPIEVPKETLNKRASFILNQING